MHGKLTATIALVLLSSTAVSAAAGELPSLPIDLARPLPDPQQSLMMLGHEGNPLPLLTPRISLSLMGAYLPLEYAEGDEVPLRVRDAVTGVLGLALGLGRADVGVAVPVHLRLVGSFDGEAWGATAMGDIAIVPRVVLALPGRSPLGLLFSVPVTLPTGADEFYAGSTGATAEPRLRLTVHTGRFALALRPGIRLQGGHTLVRPQLSNWLTLRAGLGVDVGPQRTFRPEIGIDGVLPLANPSAVSGEVLAGVAARPLGGLSLAFHGGVGFGSMPGIARVRVLGTVSWEGPGRDAHADLDRDGIPTSRDRCPGTREDVDGHQDADGCPDPDDDGDGVPDPADLCPRDRGEGIDGCPRSGEAADLDGDGIRGGDACPLEPEDVDGVEDEDGCPDRD